MTKIQTFNRKILVRNLASGKTFLPELISVKAVHDINELICEAFSIISDEELVYVRGKGIEEPHDTFTEMLESFDIYEITEGQDDDYGYMEIDNHMVPNNDNLIRVKREVHSDGSGSLYYCYDFNTMSIAKEEEIIDNEILDNFFASANFIVDPGNSNCDSPDRYLFENYALAQEIVDSRKEAGLETFVYTLKEAEGQAYITEGIGIVNRLGYFLSESEAEYEDGIRYW